MPFTAKGYYERGVKRAGKGKHVSAIEDFDEAIRRKSDYIEAFYYRGLSKAALGDHDEAILDYTEVIAEKGPDYLGVSILLEKAKAILQEKEQALTATSTAPLSSAEDYFKRAEAKQATGDSSGAIADLTEALRIDPDSLSYLTSRGTCKKVSGDYRGAIADFDEAIKLEPQIEDLAALFEIRAKAKQELNNFREALADFNEAIRLNPSPEGMFFYYRSVCKYNLGDDNGAMTDINKAILQDQDSTLREWRSVFLIFRGRVNYALGNYHASIIDYDEAIKLKQPCFEEAFLFRALCKRKQGKLKEGMLDIETFIQLKPDDVDGLFARGKLKLQLGDHGGAIADFEKAIQIAKPGTENAFYARGLLKSALGEYREAIVYYERARELYSGRWVFLSEALEEAQARLGGKEGQQQTEAKKSEDCRASAAKKLEAGDYAGALADYHQLFSFTRGTAEDYRNCGLAKSKLEKYREAIDDFEKAIELKLGDYPAASSLLEIARRKLATTSSSSSPSSSKDVSSPMPMKPVAALASATLPGFSIIPYQSIKFTDRRLGVGAFGVVYQAEWQHVEVAAKQLLEKHLSEQARDEFKKEAKQHGQLRHPNIVTLYGVCLEEGKYTMVMELMVKGSLYDLLRSEQGLPWSVRLTIAKDIVVGLAYLHSQSILHRDLKSLNVLLNDQLRAKLSDFGFAKVKSESKEFISTHQHSVGTINWMAPELFVDKAIYSTASDVYALGMVLWELSSRKVPFKETNRAVIPTLVREGKREDIPAGTPASLARLISRCWVQRAEDRPTTEQVLREIEGADEGAASAAEAPLKSSGYQLFSQAQAPAAAQPSEGYRMDSKGSQSSADPATLSFAERKKMFMR